MLKKEKDIHYFLNKVINSYSEISTETWNSIKNISHYIEVKKNDYICRIDKVQNSFFFVNKGLLRASAINEQGAQYNKSFFSEGMFPGSMVALLKNEPFYKYCSSILCKRISNNRNGSSQSLLICGLVVDY